MSQLRWSLFVLILVQCVNGLASATTIYDNGAPNQADGSNISGFISADDFAITAPTVTVKSVTFWSSADVDPYPSQFSGTIGWGIFADNGGTPGNLLFSGVNTAPILTDTGVQILGTEEWEVQFALPSIALTNGTYWLGLHEGTFGTPDDGTEIYWDTTGSQTGAVGMVTADLTSSSGWFDNGLVSGNGADLAFELATGSTTTTVPEPSTSVLLLIALGTIPMAFLLYPRKSSIERRTTLRIGRFILFAALVCLLCFAPCGWSQCSYSASFTGPTSFPAYGSLPPAGTAPVEPIIFTVVATTPAAYYCPGPASFGGSNGFYIAEIHFVPTSGYGWTEIVTIYLLNNPSPNPRSSILTVGINGVPSLVVYFQTFFQEGTAGMVQDPNATTAKAGKQGGNQHFPCPGMTGYSFNSLLISLNLLDTPISYKPPKGPEVAFTATYNQKEANQPSTFSYSNLGQDWTFNWLSYVTTTVNGPTTVYAKGGGTETYISYSNGGLVEYAPEQNTGAMLLHPATGTFTKLYPDGSMDIFSQPGASTSTSSQFFLTSVIDPQGNAATLTYDSQMRITSITDALGQKMTLSYGLASDPFKITAVSDPFSRQALFSYDTLNRLISIQDVIGMKSSYTYGSGNFINSLTTPYGVTNFTYGSSGTNQWLMATDPLGQTERIEYRDSAPGIAASETAAPTGMSADNSGLDVHNTFYWDKDAYASAAGDYTKAVITHWLASAVQISGLIDSRKQPLESRVFYNYAPGVADPTSTVVTPDTPAFPIATGRVLDDGSTQLSLATYNLIDKLLTSVDPLGRQTNYTYAANLIDVVGITQKNGTSNDLLFTATYNSQHLPITTTDAAAQVTKYTYNSAGQPLTITNPNNETTTMAYNSAGYLQSITGAIPGSTTSFIYDSAGRVGSVTDSEGYAVVNSYDNLNRLLSQTFPDGTARSTVYDRLSIGSTTDRLGRTTSYTNDALGRVVSIKDPKEQITNQTWCKCGALATLKDPKGNTTTWTRNIEGRVTAKTYADGKGDSFVYENTTSRLHSQTDALSQAKTYQYLADNNLLAINYANVVNRTPNVLFAYDPIYNRRTSMTDGTGSTNYTYYPVDGHLGAGKLQNISGPIANSTINYTYDPLGRVVGRSINGAANQVSRSYDALGRTISETNGLGSFTTAYVDETNRPLSVTFPNGQSTVYQYFNNLGDERLKEIKNLAGSTVLSQFDYAYDAEGEILTWAQTAGTYALGYDPDGELTSAAFSGTSPKTYGYTYDAAANRTNEIINGAAAPATANVLNELISRTGSSARSFAYDAAGEMVSNSGVGKSSANYTYQWDAENRLIGITYPTTNQQTVFNYDGLGRIVKIVEKTGGVVTATRQFVWEGLSLAEERDGSGNLAKRFYSQGQVNGTVGYFFTRDHLGSIREVLNSSGVLIGRYDYDPYGRRTVTSGNDVIDFGFTGHFYHSQSNLQLAPYRAYSADVGRWLNRDPIGEAGGPNLLAYVGNQPTGYVDYFGTYSVNWTEFFVGVGELANGVIYVDEAAASAALVQANPVIGIGGASINTINAVSSIIAGTANVAVSFASSDQASQVALRFPSNFSEDIGLLFAGFQGEDIFGLAQEFVDIRTGKDLLETSNHILDALISVLDISNPPSDQAKVPCP